MTLRTNNNSTYYYYRYCYKRWRSEYWPNPIISRVSYIILEMLEIFSCSKRLKKRTMKLLKCFKLFQFDSYSHMLYQQ